MEFNQNRDHASLTIRIVNFQEDLMVKLLITETP